MKEKEFRSCRLSKRDGVISNMSYSLSHVKWSILFQSQLKEAVSTIHTGLKCETPYSWCCYSQDETMR
jgi:hypothetical protein